MARTTYIVVVITLLIAGLSVVGFLFQVASPADNPDESPTTDILPESDNAPRVQQTTATPHVGVASPGTTTVSISTTSVATPQELLPLSEEQVAALLSKGERLSLVEESHADELTLLRTPSFEIQYDGTYQHITVIIVPTLDSPSDKSRTQAEEYLAGLLQVTREQLCRYAITITVSATVDTSYIPNMGLSSCPT